MPEDAAGRIIQCPFCRVTIPRPRQKLTATCVNCGKSVAMDDRFFDQKYVFGGEVLTRGKITVGPRGSVKANLSATEVVIEGSVTGRVKAVERLWLGGGATFSGHAAAARLVMAEGASLSADLEVGE